MLRTPVSALFSVVLLLFAASPGVATAQSAATTQAAGHVVVREPVKDLGIVGLGTDPEATFTIENRGTAAVDISVGPPATGLRFVNVDRTIAPSATGTVRVAVDTFRAGMTSAWKINVTTSDAGTPSLELTVKADVRNFLTIEPATAQFNFVQHGPEGGTSHIISAQDEAPFEIIGVDSPAERVADLPGRQWKLDLTIKGDAAVGPIDGYAIVRTNHPRQPRAFLPVTGFVRPLFAVTPMSISLSAPPEPGELAFRTLVIRNFGKPALELTKASSDIAALRATIVPVDDGHTWRVELRRDPAVKEPWKSGTLRLTTNHPQVRELTVSLQLLGGGAGAGAEGPR